MKISQTQFENFIKQSQRRNKAYKKICRKPLLDGKEFSLNVRAGYWRCWRDNKKRAVGPGSDPQRRQRFDSGSQCCEGETFCAR